MGAGTEAVGKPEGQPPAPMEKGGESLGSLQPTSNQTGFDFGQPTYKIDEWIAAYDGKHPLLDLGCGLGTNTLAALRSGASVVCVDPSEAHLASVREKAGEEAVGTGRLRTARGELASRVDEDEGPGGLLGQKGQGASGVLCAQVLHFLRPSQIPEAFQELAHYLRQGGVLVLTCASIYQLPTGLAEEAERRLSVEGPGGYPGWVVDSQQVFGPQWGHKGEDVAQALPHTMPTSFHALHPSQLSYHAEQAGLVVRSCEVVSGEKVGLPPNLVTPPSSPYHGRDVAVLVATRPLEGRE